MSGKTQYRITRVVGQGAFGTVYEAERVGEGLSRRVAMKLLHAAHAGHSGVEGRLRDEARMLSLIHHRAIVRVDDLIRVNDAWCVVMEYVAGADLGRLLQNGPLPPRAALQVAEEVASALHAAFSQVGPEGRLLHLVHRDIKPENIRLTPQGEVKLLDFGIARAEFGAREVATKLGGMGTISYMSAERFRGEDTHAGDVYALGVTLFELLIGVPPGSSAADADRRPPGRTLRAQWAWIGQLEPDLLALITAMLADEPEDRPTGRECARTLARLRPCVPGEVLEDWAERALADLERPVVTAPSSQPDVAGPLAPPARRGLRRESSLAPRANVTMLRLGQTIGPPPVAVERPAGARRWALMGVGLVVFLGLLVLTASGTAWLGWMAWSGAPEPTGTPNAVPAAVSVPPTAPAVSAPAPRTSGAQSPEGTPVPAATRPAARAGSAKSTPVASVPVASTSVASTPAPAAANPASPVAASPTRGTVVVSGAASVTLEGPAGAAAPGPVPPGMYAVTVSFPGGTRITVGSVRVEAGRTTRLVCAERFATCAISGPE
ncbi:MAG: serine/threonine-protein kinase [Pseudomonadota bacterium]|nr:serine/threonine-protein kinase [Pseudomonadota bacterium]